MKTSIPTMVAALSAAFAFATTSAGQSKDTSPPGREADRPQPGKPGQDSDTPERPRRGDDPALPALNPAPSDEADFVQKAATRGMGEVKLAELGVSKAHDEKVKECAQMLVKDHTASIQELKAIARDLKIPLKEAADPEAEKACEELNQKSGKEFDRAFLEHMATCHETGIALFEAGKKVARAEQIKAFAEKTLPVLKNHAEYIAKIGGWETRRPGPPPKPVVDPAPDTATSDNLDRPGSQPQPGTSIR